MKKQTRRKFSKEYKAEVVDLIRASDKSIGAICRELDLTETAVRRRLTWPFRAMIGIGSNVCVVAIGPSHTAAARASGTVPRRLGAKRE